MSDRTIIFGARHSIQLIDKLGLGAGQDGVVWRSSRQTAVKFFDQLERYRRELEVYRLLKARQIVQVAGHAVPVLLVNDDELLAIELTLVQPPFVLDFAGAKLLHEVPDFPEDVIDE